MVLGTNQDFIEEPVKVLDEMKMVWMDDGLHEPVELIYSDKFQPIQFKEKD